MADKKSKARSEGKKPEPLRVVRKPEIPPAKRKTETLVKPKAPEKVAEAAPVSDTPWLKVVDGKVVIDLEAKRAFRAKYNEQEGAAAEQAKTNPDLRAVVAAHITALKAHNAHVATGKPGGKGPTREAMKAAKKVMAELHASSPVVGRAIDELLSEDKELFPARS